MSSGVCERGSMGSILAVSTGWLVIEFWLAARFLRQYQSPHFFLGFYFSTRVNTFFLGFYGSTRATRGCSHGRTRKSHSSSSNTSTTPVGPSSKGSACLVEHSIECPIEHSIEHFIEPSIEHPSNLRFPSNVPSNIPGGESSDKKKVGSSDKKKWGPAIKKRWSIKKRVDKKSGVQR